MLLRQSPSGPYVNTPAFPAGPANAVIAGQASIDWSKGPAQTLTLDQNTTLTNVGLPAGEPTWVQLTTVQGGAGSHTLTIPGALTAGGAGLTLSTAVGSVDVISLFWNGTFILAQVAGLAFA